MQHTNINKTISSTLIKCPIDGRVIITAEVQNYKDQNIVMVERYYEGGKRRVSFMSIKETIALSHVLTHLQLPKER